MNYSKSLNGYRVKIMNLEDRKVIADTKIVDYDISQKIIRVMSSSVKKRTLLREEGAVQIFVYTEDGLYEFEGILRRAMIANEIEICLSTGRKRENRESVRYRFHIVGEVTAIYIEHHEITLREPIEVISLNISETGMLLQAMSGSFEIDDEILVVLRKNGKEIRGAYKVIRIQNDNLWTEEYGCRRL